MLPRLLIPLLREFSLHQLKLIMGSFLGKSKWFTLLCTTNVNLATPVNDVLHTFLITKALLFDNFTCTSHDEWNVAQKYRTNTMYLQCDITHTQYPKRTFVQWNFLLLYQNSLKIASRNCCASLLNVSDFLRGILAISIEATFKLQMTCKVQ